MGEEEWKLIYAAWCVKHAGMDAKYAMLNADEAWNEGVHGEDPEGIAELDCEA